MEKTDESVWPYVQLNILIVQRLATPDVPGYRDWLSHDLEAVAEACRERLRMLPFGTRFEEKTTGEPPENGEGG